MGIAEPPNSPSHARATPKECLHAHLLCTCLSSTHAPLSTHQNKSTNVLGQSSFVPSPPVAQHSVLNTATSKRIGRTRDIFGRNRQASVPFRLQSPRIIEHGEDLPNLGPTLAGVGRTRANFGQIWGKFGSPWPDCKHFDQFRPRFDLRRLGHMWARF